jgi:eukaryotic-like serine/threonine-protein kinase
VTHQCTVCERTFDEPGFCPFDGTQLVAVDLAKKATVVSELMIAQSGPTLSDTNQIKAISAVQGSIADAFQHGPSEYDRLVGETLDGRYFIQRKIGEGGMGVVYSARHAVIERPLAIKVLKREAMRDTATIKRFVQEAQAASRIGHPNIVDVTDFGTTPDGMTYSVMEYVDGVTLAKAIRAEAPLPAERSISVAVQIARALGAAHAKGIIHRDLKPENVFLTTRDGRPNFVKIVDFGIAKVLPIGNDPNAPKLTRAGSVFGTPEYMAPEQAAGRGDIDGRVDVYALGTILYEMTCGRTPHKSNSLVRTIAMQLLDPITPLGKAVPELAVHPAFERVVMKALAKQREDRYATMAELVTALEAVLAELKVPEATLSLPPVPPGADPLPAKPRRAKGETRPLHEPEFASAGPITVLPQPTIDETPPPPSRRWPLAAVALIVLALGGAAVWYAARPSPPIAEAVRDAGIEAVLPTDASIAMTDDAQIVALDDARAIVAIPADGRRVATVPPHPETVTIEVMTRPGEADVYVGPTFRGPSGAQLTEPWGTRLTVECRAKHYKGKVDLVFDGSQDVKMCTAVRLRPCGAAPAGPLKTPFGDCDPD